MPPASDHDKRPKSPRSFLPEILAPAGDLASLRAALASGADAVYLGLDDGFNARARAANFSRSGLADTVREVHRAGARVYLTLNTLVFESELEAVEAIVRDVARAGVDALIVQDPAVALIARAVCPDLEVHASTQMTISSPEAAELCRALGITRVVVPRELSVDEIRKYAAGTELELEVFIHGALCMSWSGQCLTSEAWGGRSANRGQCAQACRLPYDLVVDGETRPLGDVQYLLSPKDLAGVGVVRELADIGVHGLKIEGRQKGPLYVATATAAYRRALDGGTASEKQNDLAEMALSYSRGLSEGFLRGTNHQSLVEGRFPEHRGVYIGRVTKVARGEVTVVRQVREGDQAPARLELTPGMGVVFDQGTPEVNEPGGPIFRVAESPKGVVLGFGRPGPDLAAVHEGDRVFVTSDPALAGRVKRRLDGEAAPKRIGLTLHVSGAAGLPLTVVGAARGRQVSVASDVPLTVARAGGLDATLLADKLGALGETPFRLEGLDVSALAAGLHLPVSALKELRRRLCDTLFETLEAPRTLVEAAAVPQLRSERTPPADSARPALLVPLCRTDAQLDAALALGFPEIELDWMEMVGLGRAVERVRAAGRRVVIATVRVQKPGEEGFDSRIARLSPDAVLVRHFGALIHFSRLPADRRPTLHGDFSLNVTNSVTAKQLLDLGLDTITAAHDLDERQLFALLAAAPADRFGVTVHHHIPTFHTEHCVYAHTLSQGRDFRTCGRPCEAHRVGLRDTKDRVHPVVVDVSCRNTVFNAEAQTAPGLVARLMKASVARLRVELVWETRAEAELVLSSFQQLVAGWLSPEALLAKVGAHEQFGVTAGTMAVIGR